MQAPFEAALAENEIPVESTTTSLDAVHQNFQRSTSTVDLRKRVMGLAERNFWDVYTPLGLTTLT